MKFIGIADLHFALYGQDPINVVSGLPDRLHNLNIVIRNILDYALEESIETVVIAGDINHTKSIIHSLALSVFIDIIRDYRSIKIICIDGNHDMSSKSGSGVSALKALDYEKNVIMLHEPWFTENIWFVPWNAKTMINSIKNPPSSAEYLISHFGLNEGELSSGISIVSDIGLKDLKNYKHCYLGHYHTPQTVGNVTYLGSIMQMDWGEKNEEKRFMIIDTDNHSDKSILTEGYKKHYELDLDDTNKSAVIQQARILKDNGHYIKINKLSNKVDVSDINQEFRIIDKVDTDITNRGINTSMSMDDKLKRYLGIKEVPEIKFEFYLEVAKQIISDSIGEK